MGTVERFEDLIAWQKARKPTKEVYGITRVGALSSDYGLRDQLQRAAVSVMSNLAEGYERNSAKDFHRFISIAKASCAEVRSLLYVARDASFVSNEGFASLKGQAEELARVIGGLKASVKRQIEKPPAGIG